MVSWYKWYLNTEWLSSWVGIMLQVISHEVWIALRFLEAQGRVKFLCRTHWMEHNFVSSTGMVSYSYIGDALWSLSMEYLGLYSTPIYSTWNTVSVVYKLYQRFISVCFQNRAADKRPRSLRCLNQVSCILVLRESEIKNDNVFLHKAFSWCNVVVNQIGKLIRHC